MHNTYPDLKTNAEIADEVFAHYGGNKGEEQLTKLQHEEAMGKGDIFERAARISAIEKLKNAIRNMWRKVMDFFGIKHTRSIEEFRQTSMRDLARGVNPFDSGNGGGASLRKAQKRALETAELTGQAGAYTTAISSADGAKVLNDIDKLAEEYEKMVAYVNKRARVKAQLPPTRPFA